MFIPNYLCLALTLGINKKGKLKLIIIIKEFKAINK